MSEEVRPHRGLSPSSLALFQGCNRKYFYKKVVKYPIDTDTSDDLLSFAIGKAFHKVLEDTKHELEGVPLTKVVEVCTSFGLDGDEWSPMVAAMLMQYKAMHKNAGLSAHTCEVIVETDQFYGIVDVILVDKDMNWWIGDMKTAGTWRPEMDVPKLPRHPQLNLYAYHHLELAEMLDLDPDKFKGCRYRVTTKSKLVKKVSESVYEYIQRMREKIISLDIILPIAIMAPGSIYGIHQTAARYIAEFSPKLDEASFDQNFGNCTAYFRPCEFWSRCHGALCSNMKDLEVISHE